MSQRHETEPGTAVASATTSTPTSTAESTGVGTQMMRSLAGEGFAVQAKALAPRGDSAKAPVQKKAAIGPSYQKPDTKDPAVAKIAADPVSRRFKSQSELEQFAANKKVENAGEMPDQDKTWVRHDEMHVLGEKHAKPVLPDILTATGTRKFRYEAFAKHDTDRTGASPKLKANIDQRGGENMAKIGLKAGPTEQAHEAEHAVPKYARTVADIQAFVDAQKTAAPKIKQVAVGAGTELSKKDYSLAQALLDGFLTALLYVQSYSAKILSHPLKAFYKAHAAAVDEAIAQLQAAPNTVPDFGELGISAHLAELTDVYEGVAKADLKLDKAGAVDDFKGKLDRNGEDKQGVTERASQLDYLRDASMLEMIKESKAAGDKLFVIGDAHRKKLGPLIDALSVKQMDDTTFVDNEKARNADSDTGAVTADERETQLFASKVIAAGKSAGRFEMRPEPAKVDDIFVLSDLADLPNCSWVVTGAQRLGSSNRYKATESPVHARLVWSVRGQTKELRSLDKVLKATKPTPKTATPSGAAAPPAASAAPAASDKAPGVDPAQPDRKDAPGAPTG